MIDLRTRARRELTTRLTPRFAWAPEDTGLVVVQRNEGITLSLHWVAADGTERTTLRAESGADYDGPARAGDHALAVEQFSARAQPGGRLLRVPVAGGEPVTVHQQMRGYAQPAPSPDATRVAFAGGRAGIQIIDVATGAATDIAGEHQFPTAPVWSADASALYGVSHTTGGIFAFDAATGAEREITRPDGQATNVAVDSANGRLVYGVNYTLFVVDLDGSDLREIAHNGQSPTWSPDGRYLAYARRVMPASNERPNLSDLVVLDTATGKEQVLVTDISGLEPKALWSRSGTKVAVPCGHFAMADRTS